MPATPTTPSPVYVPNMWRPEDENLAGRMPGPEKSRWRSAAVRARSVYPGPVGDLVARELLVVEEFGWALGGDSLLTQVLADVEAQPVKPHIDAQSVARGHLPSP
jgi:hypothetical protein